jgi:SAM-dependent methyltransferase
MSTDKETLGVYAARVDQYAAIDPSAPETEALEQFLARLKPGAHILDIGCGPGKHGLVMQSQGFEVTAWDATPEFVEHARKSGLNAEVGTFASLTEIEAFDAIWASFSLLHTPKAEHGPHILAMARALRPGGYLYLGMKLGDGEARDAIGRFYSYVTRAELETMALDAGLAPVETFEGEGKGLAGTVDPFILMTCQKTGQADA